MKKIIIMALAIALVFTSSACTQTQEPSASGNSASQAGDKAPAAALPTIDKNAVPDLNGVTINLVTPETWDTGYSLSDVLPKYKQIEERTGVKLKWDVIKDDYDTVIQTRLAASDLPDIVSLPLNSVTLSKVIEGDILTDISKYWDNTPNIYNFFNETNTYLRKSLTYLDGGIYALPNATWRNPDEKTEWLAKSGDNALWYRGDIADKLGIKMPTTLDEVYNMFKTVHETYPDMVVCMMYNWNNWDSARIFNSAYGLHFNYVANINYFYPDANNKIQFEPMLDATREWVTEMNKWYEEGLISTMKSDSEKYGLPATGKAFCGFYSEVTEMAERPLKETVDPNAYMTFMPFPKGKDATCTVAGRDIMERCTGIVDNGEEQSIAAMKFLDYAFFSDYGVYSNCWGVDGEQWNMVDGKGVPNDEYNIKWFKGEFNPQSVGANAHNILPANLTYESQLTGKQTNMRLQKELNLPGKTEAQQANWDEVSAANAAYSFQPMSFMFMESEDNSRFSELSADVNRFVDENLEKFILGEQPLSDWDKYVNSLKNDLHIEEMIEIQQRTYDRFMAS